MGYIGKVPADVLIDPHVDSASIVDSTIVTADIANDAVTSAKLAANSVDSSELIDGSVDNSHLAGSIAMNKTLLSAGTGLTLSTNTLNVDAAQTQITSVGTLTGLTTGAITQNTGTFTIKNASSDSNGLKILQDSSDASKIYNHYNGTLELGVSSTTTLAIKSSAVGIGTTSPATATNVLLTVGDASLGYTGMEIRGGTNAESWRLYSSYDGNNDAIFGLYRVADNSYKFQINESGNATFANAVSLGTQSSGLNAFNINRARFQSHENNNVDMSVNLAYNGSAWVNDDDSQDSQLLRLYSGAGLFYYVSSAQANPSLSEKFKVDTSGNATFAGNIQTSAIGIGKVVQSGYEIDGEVSSGNFNMRLKATGTNQGIRMDLDHHSGDKAEIHFYSSGNSSCAIVSNEITNGLIFKVGGTASASKKDAFQILNNGNSIFSGNYKTGIGTGSPTNQLTVYADTSAYAQMIQQNQGDGAVLDLYASASDDHAFDPFLKCRTDADDLFMIDNAGNWYSGDNFVSNPWDASGSSNYGSLYFQHGTASLGQTFATATNVSAGGGYANWYSNIINASSTTHRHVQWMNDGTSAGTITYNSSNSVAYNTTQSDRTLKKNFANWTENVLDSFDKINPQLFHFKIQKDSEEKIKGFIAQDMLDKFPEAYPLVAYGEEDNQTEKYQFNPSGMVVYLMKAVKELSDKIKVLESK